MTTRKQTPTIYGEYGMPVKSLAQLRLVMANRNKYSSEAKTPGYMKWIWKPEWTESSQKGLPEKKG